MTGKGRKSKGSKGDKRDTSSDQAAHGNLAGCGLDAAASTLLLPPSKNYVDMKVGTPVLQYNGNLVATTSRAQGCHTKYTSNVRVPKTMIREALEANSMEKLLELVNHIIEKSGDLGSEVSEVHDLFFLTAKDAPAPQSHSQAHTATDKVAKYNPQVVVKVIDRFEGGITFDIPGRGSSRDQVLLDAFLNPDKDSITILYSKPGDYALDVTNLALGARGSGVQITSSRNPETIKALALTNYELHMQQGIFSGKKDCLAYTYISGWSATGRSKEFVGQAVNHIMTVLKQKAGDTSLLKAGAIIAIYDRLIKDLELEDLQH